MNKKYCLLIITAIIFVLSLIPSNYAGHGDVPGHGCPDGDCHYQCPSLGQSGNSYGCATAGTKQNLCVDSSNRCFWSNIPVCDDGDGNNVPASVSKGDPPEYIGSTWLFSFYKNLPENWWFNDGEFCTDSRTAGECRVDGWKDTRICQNECGSDSACNNLGINSEPSRVCGQGNSKTQDKCSSTCNIVDTNKCGLGCGGDSDCVDELIGDTCVGTRRCNAQCECISAVSVETTGAQCTDEIDNDADGTTDCGDTGGPDTGCSWHYTCEGKETGFSGTCTDGVDNDADRTTDCADPDCYDDPTCQHCSASSSHTGGDQDTGDNRHYSSGGTWQSENCATKLTEDSDISSGISDRPVTAGTVTDYLTCSNAACTTNTDTDSCSGTTLTEYYIDSGDMDTPYLSKTYNCATEFGGRTYCSDGDVYTQNWGCSDNTCNDDAVADTREDCVDSCSDTDSGRVYTTRGTVTDNDECSSEDSDISCRLYTKIDSCITGGADDGKLKEYYCSGNNFNSEKIVCSARSGADYVCDNGKCIDKVSPTVNIDSPAPGWKNEDFNLQYDATDGSINTCETHISTDEESTWTVAYTSIGDTMTCDSDQVVQITVGSTDLCNIQGTGKCYVKIYAKDNAGNENHVVSIYDVDYTLPTAGTFTIDGKNTGTVYTNDETLAHAWSGFTDSGGSNLYSFEIWRALYDATNCPTGAEGTCNWNSHHSDAIAPASGSWTETSFTADYWYGWHSSDNAGNWIHEAAPIRVVFDNTGPTIDSFTISKILLPPPDNKYQITYTITTTDSNGVNQVQLSVGGTSKTVTCNRVLPFAGTVTCTYPEDFTCSTDSYTTTITDVAGISITDTKFHASASECLTVDAGRCGQGATVGHCNDACNFITSENSQDACNCAVAGSSNSVVPSPLITPADASPWESTGWQGDITNKCIGDTPNEFLVRQISSWDSCGGSFTKDFCPGDPNGETDPKNCFSCNNIIGSSDASNKCAWQSAGIGVYLPGTRIDAFGADGEEDVICISGSSAWFDIPVVKEFEYYDNGVFNAKYEAFYPVDPDRDMKVKCALNCDPNDVTQNCGTDDSPVSGVTCLPYDQSLGTSSTKQGNCVVSNPSYNLPADNTIYCVFYDSNRPDVNTLLNRNFKPVDFEIRATEKITTTVGEPFTLKIDITNKGLLSDRYTVTISAADSNAVDISSSSATTETISSKGITSVYSSIRPLVDVDNVITVTVSSAACTTCPVQTISMPLRSKLYSLPEFGLIGFLQIIGVAGIIYFLIGYLG